jgi:hypothetical protein
VAGFDAADRVLQRHGVLISPSANCSVLMPVTVSVPSGVPPRLSCTVTSPLASVVSV